MIGTMVGTYKITEKIGEGGMGAVFKGVDTMLEREVAIKMLRPELARQPQIVERFRSEAVTLAKLNHPNIATLYSFLRQGEDFFMVMEFVRGRTLDDVIRQSGAMSPSRAIPLFCEALQGIAHAHKMGIVHRDIKPANMMLTESDSIKVMDFGIARVLGSARMTRQGNIVGTIEYMSPEQVRGEESDTRSDLYSLGILLYEMLTGRVPFSSRSEFELMRAQIEEAPVPPRDFAPHIPKEVEQAIMRALAKKPEARFGDVAEFKVSLESTNRSTVPGQAETIVSSTPPIGTRDFAETISADRMPKETRLAARADASTAPALRETRLAAGQTPAQPYQPPAKKGGSSPIILGGIALLIVAVVGVGLGFMLMSKQSAPVEPPVTAQPAAPEPVQSQPAPSAGIPIEISPQPTPSVENIPGQTDSIVLETPEEPKAKPSGRRVADAAERERARKRAEALKALDQ